MSNPTQRWTDDHLDQLAAAVESNTRNVDILVGIVTGQQQRGLTMLEEMRDIKTAVESNTRNVDILVGIVSGQQERGLTMLEEMRGIKVEIRELQNEIRGLQTENKRILDHLFGQEE